MSRRKRHVAEVALKLFVEKGIQQTSIQDIIEQSNISKGTFYNYFSSKNDCIAEILEGLRYDASQRRMEMLVGNDEMDRGILIEQISLLIQLNEERKLSTLFEAILNSNEIELKKLVMHHRMYEMEWLANRFTEVFGDHTRDYAFECSVLFHGMMQYIMFSMKISNTRLPTSQIVDVLLSYIEQIIPVMMDGDKRLLDPTSIHLLKMNVDRKPVSIQELLAMAAQLKEESNFTIEQQDLYDAIISELQQKRIRKCVIQPLLKPFLITFSKSPMENQAKVFINMLWYHLKSL